MCKDFDKIIRKSNTIARYYWLDDVAVLNHYVGSEICFIFVGGDGVGNVCMVAACGPRNLFKIWGRVMGWGIRVY